MFGRALDIALGAVSLIGLLILGLLLSSTIPTHVAVHGCDEGSFSLIGALFPNVQLAPSWSPLYGAWHALLYLFHSDRLDEYYFNYRVLATVTPPLIFFVFRCIGVSPAGAVLVAGVFSLSPSALHECPQVNHFAALVFLLGLVLARIFPDPANQRCFFAFWTLVLSYIRPEYFLAALPLGLVALRRFRPSPIALSFLLISAVLFVTFGNPLRDEVYDRNIEVFGPGFAAHWARDKGVKLDFHHDWRPVIEEVFGDIDGPLDAFRQKPGLVIWYLLKNLADFPRPARAAFLNGFLADSGLRVIILLGAIGVFALRRAERGEPSGERKLTPELLYALCCAGAIFFSLLFPPLYPRFLYVLVLVSVAALALVTARQRTPSRPGNLLAGILVVALLLFSFRAVNAFPPKPPKFLSATEAGRTALGLVTPAQRVVLVSPPSLAFLFIGNHEVVSFKNSSDALASCGQGADFAVFADISEELKNALVEQCFSGEFWQASWNPSLGNLVTRVKK